MSEEAKKKKHFPFLRVFISIIIVLIIGVIGFDVYYWFQCQKPMSATSEKVTFVVEQGATLKSVSEDLEKDGLIRNSKVGYYFAKLNSYGDLKAGSFTLDTSMDMDTLYKTLNSIESASNGVSVTIIEGDWAKDIANKISTVTEVSYDELIALWSNADWIRSKMPEYPFLTEEMLSDNVRCYLEGYLFPNTYDLKKNCTAEEVTCTLLDQTLSEYNSLKDKFDASSYSIHQIFTLASIIQYEGTGNMEDLKNISSVFYNRLEAGMALQSSVTVCYALDFDKDNDNWQACEVNTDIDSPYNTYMNPGLPPGPIDNAGTAALEAALSPNDTSYVYFIGNVCGVGDQDVYFASTYEEHQQNIDTYLTCYGY